MDYRASMEALAPSTVNVRLSAVRKLVAEARKNGLIGVEHAASLLEVPNIRQKGTRLGNWPTREQAKELLGVPDRSTLKGKRDYVILALLVGCALRRQGISHPQCRDHPASGGPLGAGRSRREGKTRSDGSCADLGQARNQCLDDRWCHRGGPDAAFDLEGREDRRRRLGSSASEPTTCAGPAPSSAARAVATWNRSSFCSGTLPSRRLSGISALSRRLQSR